MYTRIAQPNKNSKEQEFIEAIITNSKIKTVAFRGQDLFVNWVQRVSDYELPRYVQDDRNKHVLHNEFVPFKARLLNELTRRKIPFIASHDDYLDVYPNPKQKQDEDFIDEIYAEINKLEVIENNPNMDKKTRVDALNKQFELLDEIRAIRSKWR